MPRTRLDERNERFSKIVELIWGRACYKGLTDADLAQTISTSAATIARRRNKPEDFTIEEITKLGRGLNIPIEDIRAAIRY